MAKIKHVIYDLDGTLDDTMPDQTKVFVKILEELGITDNNIGKHYNYYAGTPLKKQFERELLPFRMQDKIEQCYTTFWKRIERNHANPFPETKNVITQIYQQGRNQFISTGTKTHLARQRLEEMNLISYFKLILGQDENIEKGLAHLHAFKKLTADIEFEKRAVYLGDGTMDMKYATEFGITAIGITNTLSKTLLHEAGAQYVISNLAEFQLLLQFLD